MLLVSSEHDTIPINELLLAVSESARYLEFVGIKTSVDESGFSAFMDESALPTPLNKSKSKAFPSRGRCPEGADEVESALPSDAVIALYDTFQFLTEQLIGHATLLMISYGREGLRLAADTDIEVSTENAPLQVSIEQQDDILFMTVKTMQVEKRHKRVTTGAHAEKKGGE